MKMASPNYQMAMYAETDDQRFEQLLHQHAPLVKRIAHHLMARMPASVQVDDLIQAGMIGLFEAAKKYDTSKGASFETYAGIRIRGAMLDEVRKGDWAPRSVHRYGRQIADAIKSIESNTGRDAQDREIAQALDISLDDYYQHLQDLAGTRLFSFEDLEQCADHGVDAIPGDSPEPLDRIQRERFLQALTEAISTLPEREQMVLALYYDEGLNLKEVGAVLGVSESRVSQLHGQAAMRLRSRLSSWL